MKHSLFLILAISVFFSTGLAAQKLSAGQQEKVNQIFKKGKVYYFKFPVNSIQEITPLSKIISIDSNKGNTVFAHATKEQFSKFIVMNYPYTSNPKTAVKGKVKKSPVKK